MFDILKRRQLLLLLAATSTLGCTALDRTSDDDTEDDAGTDPSDGIETGDDNSEESADDDTEDDVGTDPSDRTDTGDDDYDTRNDYGDDSSYGGQSDSSGEPSYYEFGDWIDVEGYDFGMVVLDANRRSAEDFNESGEDVFVIELRVANQSDEAESVPHDEFFLEEIGPNHPPDTSLSSQLDNGATDEQTELAVDEDRPLMIAFRVPNEITPAYLWFLPHYICLV